MLVIYSSLLHTRPVLHVLQSSYSCFFFSLFPILWHNTIFIILHDSMMLWFQVLFPKILESLTGCNRASPAEFIQLSKISESYDSFGSFCPPRKQIVLKFTNPTIYFSSPLSPSPDGEIYVNELSASKVDVPKSRVLDFVLVKSQVFFVIPMTSAGILFWFCF